MNNSSIETLAHKQLKLSKLHFRHNFSPFSIPLKATPPCIKLIALFLPYSMRFHATLGSRSRLLPKSHSTPLCGSLKLGDSRNSRNWTAPKAYQHKPAMSFWWKPLPKASLDVSVVTQDTDGSPLNTPSNILKYFGFILKRLSAQFSRAY